MVENAFDSSSNHELLQLLQSSKHDCRMFNLDYNDPAKNLIAYGCAQPPEYEIEKINATGISIWYGIHDDIVSADAIDRLIERFRGE